MGKKIKDFTQNHPVGIILFSSICLLSLIATASIWKPALVNSGIAIAFMAIVVYACIKTRKGYKKKERTNTKIKYCNEQYKEYVTLVKQTLNENKCLQNNIYANWLEKFENLINLEFWEVMERKFNDFDIATCLIYALTWEDDINENIIIAFRCAKKLIERPKEYHRDKDAHGKVDLEVYKRFPKSNVQNLTENQQILSYIKACLAHPTEKGMLELSDFLYILYLKCK